MDKSCFEPGGGGGGGPGAGLPRARSAASFHDSPSSGWGGTGGGRAGQIVFIVQIRLVYSIGEAPAGCPACERRGGGGAAACLGPSLLQAGVTASPPCDHGPASRHILLGVTFNAVAESDSRSMKTQQLQQTRPTCWLVLGRHCLPARLWGQGCWAGMTERAPVSPLPGPG